MRGKCECEDEPQSSGQAISVRERCVRRTTPVREEPRILRARCRFSAKVCDARSIWLLRWTCGGCE